MELTTIIILITLLLIMSCLSSLGNLMGGLLNLSTPIKNIFSPSYCKEKKYISPYYIEQKY